MITYKRNSDKQDSSSKTITFIVKDIDPNILCEKLNIILEKLVESEIVVATMKMIIGETLRTKKITRTEYNTLYIKHDFQRKLFGKNFQLL